MSKPTEGMNVTMILVVGLLSFALLFVIVIGLQAWYYVMLEREYERKVVAERYEPLDRMVEDQNAQLAGGTTDDNGPTIGIDKAMELVIEQRGAR